MNLINKLSYHFGRIISPLILNKYHYTCNSFMKCKEPTLIISNHLTEVDSFMLMRAFKSPMYFVSGAHLLESKVGKILNKLFPTIFFKRGNLDYTAIRKILKTIKKDNVIIFPEGCRSFNGETLEQKDSIVKLAKLSKCQIITFKIIGGYFVAPRWAYSARVGKMQGEIINIYSKELISNMDDNELLHKINHDIYENAYERQKITLNDYKGKRLAEGIENYLEICPKCGSIDSFTSKDDEFYCNKCNLKGKYLKTGLLENFPFDSLYDYGKWEDEKLLELANNDGIIFEAFVSLYIVSNNKSNYQKKDILKAYKDKMYLGDLLILYKDITSFSLLYYGRILLFTYKGIYYKATDFYAYKFYKLIEFYKSNN